MRNKINSFRHSLACLGGHVIDHFDTTLYSLLVPLIAPLFFPARSPVAALVAAYGLSFLGIVSRPLGSWFFGKYALHKTPQDAFARSLAGLSATTAAIGLLPSYEHIGVAAPFLLAFLRFLQGFFAAGEAAVAPYFYLHIYPPHKRPAKNSILGAMTVIGIFAASGAVWLVNLHPQPQTIWRIPFVVCLPAGLFSLLIRRSLDVKPEDDPQTYLPQPFDDPSGLAAMAKRYKVQVLQIMCASALGYVTYALPFVFLNAWVPAVTDIPAARMLGWNTALLGIDAAILIILGCLPAVKTGALMLYPAMFLCAILIPCLGFIPGASLIYVTAVRFAVMIPGIAYSSALHAWQMRILPRNACYRLSGAAGSIGSEVFGRSLPAVCMGIWHVTGSAVAVGAYCAMLAAAGAWAVHERRCHPLPGQA